MMYDVYLLGHGFILYDHLYRKRNVTNFYVKAGQLLDSYDINDIVEGKNAITETYPSVRATNYNHLLMYDVDVLKNLPSYFGEIRKNGYRICDFTVTIDGHNFYIIRESSRNKIYIIPATISIGYSLNWIIGRIGIYLNRYDDFTDFQYHWLACRSVITGHTEQNIIYYIQHFDNTKQINSIIGL